jgi:hypothetical protein
MYPELVRMLGLSQSSLEFLVLAVIGIAILGTALVLFWRYVLAGIGLMFCFVVLANHKPSVPIEEIISVTKPAEVVAPVKPVEPEKDDLAMFIEDCMKYTDYSKKHCEMIWNSREQVIEQDAENADLLNVENVEYRKRRAAALKKKNAVVLHATYHN